MPDSQSAESAPRGSEPKQARVFINERGVSVAHGAIALDAVRAFDADQADAVRAGSLRLTDSRGLPVAAESVVHGGAIYRLVPVRESASESSAADASGESS